MQSEFHHVALDCVRYSLVWEDAGTLYDALDIAAGDHLLVITSAGCNVFNALLKDPATVTAIDLNPVQNKLLLLKKHIVLRHDHATLRACLGLDGKEAVAAAWQRVQATLPEEAVAYWAPHVKAHAQGLLASGRLETYIHGFYQTLDSGLQYKLQQLLYCSDVEEQYNYFMRELHPTSFSSSFIEYFDDKNLSKGRDPKLSRYAGESGGQAFYNRLVKQVSSQLVSSNFYFRFFFFGPLHIPEELLPPCYRQQHFEELKRALSKLTIVTAEAIDYLMSPRGKHINKASLSNIFEYTSEQEFIKVCSSLYQESTRKLRIVFWNLLHEQGLREQAPAGMIASTADPLAAPACFYFKGVRILDRNSVASHQPELITKQ